MHKTIPDDWDEDLPGIDMDRVADVAMHGILAPEPKKSQNKLAAQAGQAIPKPRRIKLDADAYRETRRRVMERDGWRCVRCGNRRNLQVDHIKKRSQLGDDDESNLQTLCADCHRAKDFYGHAI
jgi:HNH endonuclease